LRARTLDRGSVTAEFVLLLPLIVMVLGLVGSLTFGQLQLLQTLQAGQQVARAMQLGQSQTEASALAISLGVTLAQPYASEPGMPSNIKCIYVSPIRKGPLSLANLGQRVCYLSVGQ
jgi:Flp pilus assembly protein TadG